MRKYIITFEDNSEVEEGGVKYFRCTQAPWSYTSEIMISKLTPYTEPDLDAVKKEAYQRGVEDGAKSVENWNEQEKKLRMDEAYKKGLSDAWETVKELFSFTFDEHGTIFKTTSVRDIVRKYSASEAIEKIRQYDDMKIKIFKPGNEVVSTLGVGIVTKVTRTGVELFHKDGSTGYDKFEAVKKTGRDFAEFVELLAKMRGESNDTD